MKSLYFVRITKSNAFFVFIVKSNAFIFLIGNLMKQKIRTRFHDKNINALETTIETIKCITFSDTFFQMKSFFNMEKDFIWKKILRKKKMHKVSR